MLPDMLRLGCVALASLSVRQCHLAMVADPFTRRGEEPVIVGVVHNGQAGLQHCPDVPKDAEFCLVLVS